LGGRNRHRAENNPQQYSKVHLCRIMCYDLV
jgi:hypothetical protein